MYGTAVVLILLVVRVVIPVGLLLWIGEIVRQRQPLDVNRTPGQA